MFEIDQSKEKLYLFRKSRNSLNIIRVENCRTNLSEQLEYKERRNVESFNSRNKYYEQKMVYRK